MTGSAVHDHVRSTAQQARRLGLAAALNAAVVIVQVVAGVRATSLGLLSDAGHNLADTLAVVLALIALRLSRRLPSGRRTFGGLRWPVLAAQANAAALLVVTLWLAIEAVRRLIHPEPVSGAIVFVVALAAAVINAGSAAIVHERHADLNTRAAVLHLAGDAIVSVAVAAAGAVIWAIEGAYWLDPAVSLLVVLLVGAQAIRLLRQSSSVLLEATPSGIDIDRVRDRLIALPGVVGVHDVHVWSLSDRMHAASVHICLEGDPPLTAARERGTAAKELLLREFGIDHATVELETTAGAAWCADEPDDCAALERHLGADRVPQAPAQSPP